MSRSGGRLRLESTENAMKRFGSILALAGQIFTSGCASYGLPKPHNPVGTGSSDWSAVVALQRHFVFVTLTDGIRRQGGVWSVSDTSLTLWEVDGKFTMSRESVARVVDHVQIGSKQPGWYKYAAGGFLAGFFGSIAGVIIGAVNKNATLKHASWRIFGLSLAFGLGVGEITKYPLPVFEDRVAYIRP
jgi:hypothetical protein